MTIQIKEPTYNAQINSIYLNQNKQFDVESQDQLYMEAIRDKDMDKLMQLVFGEIDLNRKVKLSFSAQAELQIWTHFRDKEFLHSFYEMMLEAYNEKTNPVEVACIKECLLEDKQLPDWLWKAVLRADQDRIAKGVHCISSSAHEEWAAEVSLFYIAAALQNEDLTLFLLDHGYHFNIYDMPYTSCEKLKAFSENYYKNLMKSLLARGYRFEDFLLENESIIQLRVQAFISGNKELFKLMHEYGYSMSLLQIDESYKRRSYNLDQETADKLRAQISNLQTTTSAKD